MKSSGIKSRKIKSRKEIRKEQRKQKKVNRALHYKKSSEFRARAHSRVLEDEKVVKVNKNKNEEAQEETVHKARHVQRKNIPNEKKVEKQKKKQKKQLLKKANLEEDKIIKKLEKQLKLNKRKKTTIPKSFVEDGLDDLLDFCKEKDRKYMVEAEKEHFESEFSSELNKDLLETGDEKTCAIDKSNSVEKNKSKLENEEESESELSENESVDFDATSEEEFDSGDDSEDISQTKVSKTENKKIESKQTKEIYNIDSNNDLWEDIYGRKRDRDGNVIQSTNRYIPPAARTSNASGTTSENEKLHLLRKQLKGCLNRITEHNMHSIVNQIEEMYMKNSRNDMNYVLSEMIIGSLVSHIITPTRLIFEHMMLIVILHANIGIEVSANFLEKLVLKFVELMEKSQDVENKELDNVILMISYLYNFKLFGHELLYQILDKLMTKFTEKEIELILLVLKTVGFSLRKDDPNALKEFIQNLQQKANQENETNSRVKFMLEILLAIKNNNINKIPQYDPFHVEHLRKVAKSNIRKGNTITRFNVSLDDLLNASNNGKWWIIGSAWSGSINTDVKANVKQHNKINFDEKIIELARKQRMNTDIRRNIFCVLMTAEDYLDAFEKLHHLGLKDQQAQEIVYVIMHCCLREKRFNPYYAILAQKLCEYNRKYQLTIQYTFWDKLKTLQSYDNKQLSNLAKFLTHLFIEKCLALSILKIIEFTDLSKHTMQFVRQILLEILSHENEVACIQVFERISVSPQLQNFRESLRLFINCFVLKYIDSYSKLEENKTSLKGRLESVDKILMFNGAKVVF